MPAISATPTVAPMPVNRWLATYRSRSRSSITRPALYWNPQGRWELGRPWQGTALEYWCTGEGIVQSDTGVVVENLPEPSALDQNVAMVPCYPRNLQAHIDSGKSACTDGRRQSWNSTSHIHTWLTHISSSGTVSLPGRVKSEPFRLTVFLHLPCKTSVVMTSVLGVVDPL